MASIQRVSSHVFVRRLIPRHLNELNDAEHSHPDQLNSYPNIKEKRKGVSKHKTTDLVIQNIADWLRRGGQSIDILQPR